MAPRSYSAGERATATKPSSVVRVYERRDLPDRFFYTRAWITTASGRPREKPLPEGTTWEAAQNFADATAAERKRTILAGRNAFGEEVEPHVTLGALLDAYEESERATGWSDRHASDVAFSIAFWRRELGDDVPVMDLTAAVVEKAAGRGARRRKLGSPERWARKRLAHLRAAVRWGWRKAGMYDRNPLEGVELPDYEPDTDALIYTEAETRLLWTPHPEVDWRVTLLVSIAADTGRRLSAMLALTTEDVVTDGERVFLHFRGEYDKGGRGKLVPVSAATAGVLADALEEDLVQEWGWLFPEGRLDFDDPRDKPWGDSAAISALHDAETVLGIPRVKKRGYHGVKRRHVTTSMEVSSGDTALVGDVTGNLSAELLRRVYRKANRRRTTRHVDAVRKALQEEPEAPESARESPRDPEAES